MPFPDEKFPGNMTIEASKWNEMVRLVKQFDKISVAQGMTLDRSGVGITFGLDISFVKTLLDTLAAPVVSGVHFASLTTLPQIANFVPPEEPDPAFTTEGTNPNTIQFDLLVKDSTVGLRSLTAIDTFINMGVNAFNSDSSAWERLGSDPTKLLNDEEAWKFRLPTAGASEDNEFNQTFNRLINNDEATGGGSNFIEDTGASYTIDEFKGATISLTFGSGAGQTKEITGNSSTRISVTPNWTTNPANGTFFTVFKNQNRFKGFATHVFLNARTFIRAADVSLIKNIDFTKGFYFNIQVDDTAPGTIHFMGAGGVVLADEAAAQDDPIPWGSSVIGEIL